MYKFRFSIKVLWANQSYFKLLLIVSSQLHLAELVFIPQSTIRPYKFTNQFINHPAACLGFVA
jgi:hypothetical protein